MMTTSLRRISSVLFMLLIICYYAFSIPFPASGNNAADEYYGFSDVFTDSTIIRFSSPAPSKDFQVPLRFNGNDFDYSKANTDGSDIRFTDMNGNDLFYWIEKWNDSDSSIVWIKSKTAGTQWIWMKYGDPAAASESNGDSTFMFFDDFEDGVYTDKWLPSRLTGTTGATFTESGGVLTFTNCCQTTAYCPNGPAILISHDSLLIDNESFTIDVTMSQATNSAGYSTIYLDLSNTSMYGVPVQGNDIRYGIGSQAYIEDPDDILIRYPGASFDLDRGTTVLGAFYRFVLTYDGNSGSHLKIYNNTDQLVYETSHPYSYSDKTWMNAYFSVNSPGSAADIVKIYKNDPVEITASFDDGLIAWYPFNGNANDESGNGNNGTINEAVPAADRFGVADKAFAFDGINDNINCGAGISLAGKSFSISFFEKNAGSDGTIFGQGTPLFNYGLHIGYYTDNFYFNFYGNDLNYSTTSFTGDWRHWVCTYDYLTNERSIFLNGTKVISDLATGDYAGTGVFYIGSSSWGTYYYNGIIDDIKIYDRVLSEPEIINEYTNGWPPLITGLTLISGVPGDTVIITGDFFNETGLNNAVYFGPVRAEVLSASLKTLEVVVPVGAAYSPITVTDRITGLSASSPDKFTPLTPVYSDNLSFSAPAIFTHTSGTTGAYGAAKTSFADLDGDGKIDIVINNGNGNTFSVRRNTGAEGNFSFGDEQIFTTGGNYAYSLCAGDIDGDGLHDVVVPNSATNIVSVFRNTSTPGAISFAEKTDLTGYSVPLQAFLADMDLDGKPDLAVSQQGTSNKINVRRNLSTPGNISFSAGTDYTVGTKPNSITCSDFDRDGLIDIAAANYTDGTVTVLKNVSTGQGSISFNTGIILSSGAYAQGLDAGDIDGDGKDDIVVVNQTSGYFSAFRNTSIPGTLSFETALTFSTGTGPFTISLCDINGDSRPDAAVSCGDASLWLFRNTSTSGTISFDSAQRISGYSSGTAGFNDLDNDKSPDLIVLSHSTSYIYIFRNTISDLPASGLLAYYPFNGNTIDESWNGHDGTIYGATLTTDRFTNENSAYSFDGIDDYISLPLTKNQHVDFTINLWATGDGTMICPKTTEYEAYFSEYGGAVSYHVGYLVSGIFLEANAGSYQSGSIDMYTLTGAALDENNYRVRLYVNNHFVTYADFAYKVPAWQYIEIGRNVVEHNGLYSGVIDDVRIYDRVLSEAEITELYREGGWPPLTVPVAGAATETGKYNFTANWSASEFADGYLIDVATDNSFTNILPDYNNRDVLNVLSQAVTGLTANTSYYYRVRSYRASDTSDYSNTVSLTTLIEDSAPEAPLAIDAASVTTTSFTAGWNSVQGADGYRLDAASDEFFSTLLTGYNDLDVGKVLSYSVSGLSTGTQYYYRIRAYNIIGASSNSNTVTVTTSIEPPPVPEVLPASDITANSFYANWNPSAGATGYYLDISTNTYFSPLYSDYNKNYDAGSNTSFWEFGLTPGQTYYYRVRAYNTQETSDYSDTVTVSLIPDAPFVYDPVDYTQTSFTLNWQPSYGATGYRIDVAADNSATPAYLAGYYDLDVGFFAYHTVSGLSANTTYYYWVRAYNSGGTSSSAGPYPAITLPDPPEAPAVQQASAVTDSSFTANWNASANATGYRIDVSADAGFSAFISGYENSDAGDVTSYNVTGLDPFTDYYYRVRAYNTGGTGDNSDTITLRTLVGPPVVMDPDTVTQTSFSPLWHSSPGAAGYEILVSTYSDLWWFSSYYTSDTSMYIDGLTNNTAYYYAVKAYNDDGTSQLSNIVSFSTLPFAPSAPYVYGPTDLTQTSFTANWNSANLATGYRIDVAADMYFTNILEDYNDLDVGNVTSWSITGLTDVTTYYYRTSAYNAGGISEKQYYNTATTLPYPPDAAIATDAADITQTQFTARWNLSERATGYRIDVALDESFTTILFGLNDLNVGNTTYRVVWSLTPNTTYYYRVRASNSGGTADNSNTIAVTTLPSPPASAPETYQPDDVVQTGFTARWDPVENASGYLLDVATDADFTNLLSGYVSFEILGDTSTYVSGLDPGTYYYYRVRAYNAGGYSAYSGTIEFKTLPSPPPAPSGFALKSCNNKVTLSWLASTDPDFSRYIVYSGQSASTTVKTDSTETGNRNETTKEYSNLTPGEYYYFRISSVLDPEIEGEATSVMTVKVKTGYIPEIIVKWGDVLICPNDKDSINSYQWYMGTNPLPLPRGSQQFFQVTQPGMYSVRITDTDGCVNSSEEISLSGAKSIKLFPNPAGKNVSVTLNDDSQGKVRIIITDNSGKKIREILTEKYSSELIEEIALDEIDEGIYVVNVLIDGRYEHTSKLVVVK